MSAVYPWIIKIFARSWLLRENFQFMIANINRDDLTSFGELIATGKVTPVIDRRYPLNQAGDAMVYAEEGHARGKVIITLGWGSGPPIISSSFS